MEFGFNLAWLVLSIALSVGWAWAASSGRCGRAHQASFLALVILIALLFPVVSISDDLHEDQAKITSEEPRYKDDLQQRLECARIPIDPFPYLAVTPLVVTLPVEKVLHFEEVRGPVAALILFRGGFPPALHDLPPPVQA